ncbi:unnamed protein product [Parajaminaea phylloscopi]
MRPREVNRLSLDSVRSSVHGSSLSWDGSAEQSEDNGLPRRSASTSLSHLRVDVEGQAFFFATPPTGGHSSPDREWAMPVPDVNRPSEELSTVPTVTNTSLCGYNGHQTEGSLDQSKPASMHAKQATAAAAKASHL